MNLLYVLIDASIFPVLWDPRPRSDAHVLRHSNSEWQTRSFVVCAPGLAKRHIRDIRIAVSAQEGITHHVRHRCLSSAVALDCRRHRCVVHTLISTLMVNQRLRVAKIKRRVLAIMTWPIPRHPL